MQSSSCCLSLSFLHLHQGMRADMQGVVHRYHPATGLMDGTPADQEAGSHAGVGSGRTALVQRAVAEMNSVCVQNISQDCADYRGIMYIDFTQS